MLSQDFDIETNDKHPKFKFGDIVRISKYENIFAKIYTLNWSQEVFAIKKLRILYHGHIISDLRGEQIVGKLHEKALQKTNQVKSRYENLIRNKGDKILVKQNCYDN